MSPDPPIGSTAGAAPAPPRPPAAVLRTIYPRELRAIHPIGAAPSTLGRQPGPDRIELAHVTVSRRHAQLWWDASGHHAARDLGSRHGTVVGATALGNAAQRLTSGDVLRLGDVLVVYQVGDRDDDVAVERDEAAGVERDVGPGAGDLLDCLDRLWAAWFLEHDRAPLTLTWTPAAASAIVGHAWRDNLGGLDRLVHEVAMRALPRAHDVADLPAWLTATIAAVAPAPPRGPGPIALTPPATRTPPPSRDEFLQVWAELGHSVRAVAKRFGRDRRQIYRWLAAHGLRPDA